MNTRLGNPERTVYCRRIIVVNIIVYIYTIATLRSYDEDEEARRR